MTARSMRVLAALVGLAMTAAGCGSSAQPLPRAADDGSADASAPVSADTPANEGGSAEASASDPAEVKPVPAGPGQLVDATASFNIDSALAGVRGHAVATADVNGDGWSDLFVGTFADRPEESYRFFGADGPAPDRLLLGSPDGFMLDPDFQGRLGRTAGALFDDLDNDGDADLIVSRNPRDGERSSAPSEIYRNDDGVLTPLAVLDDQAGGRAVVATDFDGDGLRDLVLVKDRWSRSSTVLLRNEGDLSFRDVTDDVGFPDDVVGLGAAVGDLDGDGIDDLVIGGSNRWFLGTGDGYREAETSPLAWELHNDEDDPAHVIIADVNDDGRLDVLIGQHFNSTIDFDIPEPIRVFVNRSPTDGNDPTFDDQTDASGMPAFMTKSPQILLLDLDADGHQDVVSTASTGTDDDRQPVVVANAGPVDEQPSFHDPGVETGPHYWIDAVLLDANGDQRPDIFFVEWEPALGSRLFLNLPAD